MAAPVLDDYNRPDGPLGVSTSGHPWSSVAGTAGRVVSRQAVLALGSIAVVDAGLGGQDGSAEVTLAGSGIGVGLAFRYVDPSNWHALSQRAFSETYESGTETYQSGTETYQSGTETGIIGYEQVIVGYQKVQTGTQQVFVGNEYSAFMTYRHTYAGNSGSPGALVSSDTAGYVAPYNLRKYNYAPAYSYPPKSAWGDIYVSANSVMRAYDYVADPVKAIYRTEPVYEQKPIYETRAVYGEVPVYSTRAVYSTRPIYSTRTVYVVRLERCVAGAITALFDQRQAGAATRLRATLDGTALAVYASGGSSALWSGTSDAHLTATRHGLIGRPSEVGALGTISRFSFGPTRGGLYVPTIMP